jgi:hypothetical protein
VKRVLAAVVLLLAVTMFHVSGVRAGSPDGVQAPATAALGFSPPLQGAPVTATAVGVTGPSDSTVQPASLTPTNPQLATAQCRDGEFSYAQTNANICASHNGVLVIVKPPETSNWWGDGNPWGVSYIQTARTQRAVPAPTIPTPATPFTPTSGPGHHHL